MTAERYQGTAPLNRLMRFRNAGGCRPIRHHRRNNPRPARPSVIINAVHHHQRTIVSATTATATPKYQGQPPPPAHALRRLTRPADARASSKAIRRVSREAFSSTAFAMSSTAFTSSALIGLFAQESRSAAGPARRASPSGQHGCRGPGAGLRVTDALRAADAFAARSHHLQQARARPRATSLRRPCRNAQTDRRASSGYRKPR